MCRQWWMCPAGRGWCWGIISAPEERAEPGWVLVKVMSLNESSITVLTRWTARKLFFRRDWLGAVGCRKTLILCVWKYKFHLHPFFTSETGHFTFLTEKVASFCFAPCLDLMDPKVDDVTFANTCCTDWSGAFTKQMEVYSYSIFTGLCSNWCTICSCRGVFFVACKVEISDYTVVKCSVSAPGQTLPSTPGGGASTRRWIHLS